MRLAYRLQGAANGLFRLRPNHKPKITTSTSFSLYKWQNNGMNDFEWSKFRHNDPLMTCFAWKHYLKLTDDSLNSHAVGMAAVRPYGFKIDFVRNPLSINSNFIFTSIFQIENHEKNLWYKKFFFGSIFITLLYRQRREYLTPTTRELKIVNLSVGDIST